VIQGSAASQSGWPRERLRLNSTALSTLKEGDLKR
jgi:hypothetical protein